MAAPLVVTTNQVCITSLTVLEYNDAYSHLSKSTLVQESNIFNEKNLSVLKCVDLLNKIIFLLN